MGHYKTGGSKELKKAVDSLCGFTADKYAVSTANQFKMPSTCSPARRYPCPSA